MNTNNTIYGEGFYKMDSELLYAPNFVEGSELCLYKQNKDSYTYPVQGWYWFDTIEQACAQFSLDINDYIKTE